MIKLAKNVSTDISTLMSKLLTTLDEKIFFVELAQYISSFVEHDRIDVYLALDDGMIRSVVCNKDLSSSESMEKSQGIINNVIRTKRPYFSNDIHRDPLFAHLAGSSLKSEMCLPITHEGVIVAVVDFQIQEGSSQSFSQDDINLLTDIFNQLRVPIANIKMYLEAKRLNDVLLSQIMRKEEELARRNEGISLLDAHVVEEKSILGRSEHIVNVCKLADKLAKVSAHFIIEGEKGTGRELIAQRVHCRSARKDKAFLTIDCKAVEDNKMETEIFGEEVVGAVIKRGALEYAHGGTLVLHNFHNLSLKIQSMLLNYLEKGAVNRVGGYQSYSPDVRLVVISDRNLLDAVAEGVVSEPLYYALAKVVLKVPALRERGDDIELLASYFLNQGKSTQTQKIFSPVSLKLLREYNWPGNVRELMSVMERAYILADGLVVEKEHLMDRVQEHEAFQDNDIEDLASDYQEMTLEELEQRHICRTLDFLEGNKTKTAKVLGITVKTLYNKLHNYGMIDQREA